MCFRENLGKKHVRRDRVCALQPSAQSRARPKAYSPERTRLAAESTDGRRRGGRRVGERRAWMKSASCRDAAIHCETGEGGARDGRVGVGARDGRDGRRAGGSSRRRGGARAERARARLRVDGAQGGRRMRAPRDGRRKTCGWARAVRGGVGRVRESTKLCSRRQAYKRARARRAARGFGGGGGGLGVREAPCL